MRHRTFFCRFPKIRFENQVYLELLAVPDIPFL